MAAIGALMVVPGARNPKTFRENHYFDGMNDRELRERYNFGRDAIEVITGLVGDSLQRKTARNHALSPKTQVLITLRYLSTGSFMQTVGDSLGFDKSTVSRVVNKVIDAICELKNHFIQWPQGRDKKKNIMDGFMRKRGFPNIIGCVDGTHVRIQQPRAQKNAYINRKHFPSLNVMGVCDDRGRFTFINAAWPGSNHDSIIFRRSVLSDYLEVNNLDLEDGVLLGDSGYACSTYMMTPYRTPVTRPEQRYQAAHCSTRSIIERTFGQWKRRFGILHSEVRMEPNKVSKIVLACAILHNICKEHNEPDIDLDAQPGLQQPVHEPYEGPEDGAGTRNHITRHFFT